MYLNGNTLCIIRQSFFALKFSAEGLQSVKKSTITVSGIHYVTYVIRLLCNL